LISNKEKSNARALKFLGPLLEERLTKERELGPDWDGKPVGGIITNMALALIPLSE
jgi:hypothetical protein